MSKDAWYLAAGVNRAKVRHLAGHARLGPGWTKCGKGPYRPCLMCEAAAADERQPPVVVGPVWPDPAGPQLAAWWSQARGWVDHHDRAGETLRVLAVGPDGFYYSGRGFSAPQFLSWGRAEPQKPLSRKEDR